jgi:hypothetical protein
MLWSTFSFGGSGFRQIVAIIFPWIIHVIFQLKNGYSTRLITKDQSQNIESKYFESSFLHFRNVISNFDLGEHELEMTQTEIFRNMLEL